MKTVPGSIPRASVRTMGKSFLKWNRLVLNAVNDTVPQLLPQIVPKNNLLEQDEKEIFKKLSKSEVEKLAELGATRSANLLKTQMDGQTKRANDILKRGIEQGTNSKTIQNRIRRATGSTEGQAARFARTSTMSMMNAGLDQVYKDNSDVVAGVKHVSVLDSRTCVICGSLDGNVYYKKTSEKGQVADTGELDFHDRPALPVHASCRCIYIPISQFWNRASEILGIDIAPSGVRAAITPRPVVNWDDWLTAKNKTDPQIVKNILGLKRYALWSEGVPPEKFVSRKLEVKPVDQLTKELEKEGFITGATAKAVSDAKPKEIPRLIVAPSVLTDTQRRLVRDELEAIDFDDRDVAAFSGYLEKNKLSANAGDRIKSYKELASEAKKFEAKLLKAKPEDRAKIAKERPPVISKEQMVSFRNFMKSLGLKMENSDEIERLAFQPIKDQSYRNTLKKLDKVNKVSLPKDLLKKRESLLKNVPPQGTARRGIWALEVKLLNEEIADWNVGRLKQRREFISQLKQAAQIPLLKNHGHMVETGASLNSLSKAERNALKLTTKSITFSKLGNLSNPGTTFKIPLNFQPQEMGRVVRDGVSRRMLEVLTSDKQLATGKQAFLSPKAKGQVRELFASAGWRLPKDFNFETLSKNRFLAKQPGYTSFSNKTPLGFFSELNQQFHTLPRQALLKRYPADVLKNFENVMGILSTANTNLKRVSLSTLADVQRDVTRRVVGLPAAGLDAAAAAREREKREKKAAKQRAKEEQQKKIIDASKKLADAKSLESLESLVAFVDDIPLIADQKSEPLELKKLKKELQAQVKKALPKTVATNKEEALKLMTEFQKKATELELDRIRTYVDFKTNKNLSGFRDMNEFLLNPERYIRFNVFDDDPKKIRDLRDKLSKDIRELSKVLDKAPKFRGDVLRGMRIHADNIEDFISQFRGNEFVRMKSFTSTTLSKRTADFFGETSGEFKEIWGVKMQIKSKTGVYLNPISRLDNEEEVLFKPGTNFKIKKVVQDTDKRQIDITLEEA